MATEYTTKHSTSDYWKAVESLASARTLPQQSYKSKLEEKINKRDQRIYDKTKRLDPKLANTLSAMELQQQLSDAIDSQVYTRSDGSQYTLDYMLDDNGLSQGTREIEYHGDGGRYGVRDLYIDDTVEGNYKLGLARSDQEGYDGRYDTSLHPTWERAKNNQLSGTRGVTPNDGALLNITMPYNKATEFENLVHSNKGQIESRVGGVVQSEIDQNRPDFGGGVSEYTSPNAPMWNIDYQQSGNKLPEDTYMPKSVETQQPTHEERLERLKSYGGDERTLIQQAGSFLRGIGQGALKTGVLDTVDFIGEVAGIGDLGTAEEKEDMAKIITGFDDKYSKKYLAANEKILKAQLHDIPEDERGWFDDFIEDVSGETGVLNNLNRIISNTDGKEFVDLMGNAFANTDTTAYSLGMLIGLTAGPKGAGLGKVGVKSGATAKEAISIVKASDALSKAQKTKAIASINKEAFKNASVLQKAINLTGKNAGLLTINAGQVNDQLDEFEENTGRPATTEEKVIKYFTNLGGLYIDRLIDVSVLKGAVGKPGKELIDGLSTIVKSGPKSAARTIVETGLKAGLVVTASSVTELPTEAIQTAIEEFNKVDYFTEEGKKQFEEKVVEIANAAVAGMGGGGHMSMPSAMVTLTKPVIGKAQEGMQSTTEEMEKQDYMAGRGKFKPRTDEEIESDITALTLESESMEDDSPEMLDVSKRLMALAEEKKLAKAGRTFASVEYDEKYEGTDQEMVTYATTAAEAVANMSKPLPKNTDGTTIVSKADVESLTSDLATLTKELRASKEEGTLNEDDYVPTLQALVTKKKEMQGSEVLTEEEARSIAGSISEVLSLYKGKDSTTVKLDPKATTEEKVGTILNSRFDEGNPDATIRAIEGVLGEEGIPNQDRKLLQAKVEIFKTADQVSTEKLITGYGEGENYKPSVTTWMELLHNGSPEIKDMAREKIAEFVDSQKAKLEAYEKAGVKYKAKRGELVANNATKEELDALQVPVDTVGKTKNYYDARTENGVIKAILSEMGAMDSLNDALQESYKDTPSTTTEVKQPTKVTPDEVTTEYKPETGTIPKTGAKDYTKTALEEVGYTNEIKEDVLTKLADPTIKDKRVYSELRGKAVEYNNAVKKGEFDTSVESDAFNKALADYNSLKEAPEAQKGETEVKTPTVEDKGLEPTEIKPEVKLEPKSISEHTQEAITTLNDETHPVHKTLVKVMEKNERITTIGKKNLIKAVDTLSDILGQEKVDTIKANISKIVELQDLDITKGIVAGDRTYTAEELSVSDVLTETERSNLRDRLKKAMDHGNKPFQTKTDRNTYAKSIQLIDKALKKAREKAEKDKKSYKKTRTDKQKEIMDASQDPSKSEEEAAEATKQAFKGDHKPIKEETIDTVEEQDRVDNISLVVEQATIIDETATDELTKKRTKNEISDEGLLVGLNDIISKKKPKPKEDTQTETQEEYYDDSAIDINEDVDTDYDPADMFSDDTQYGDAPEYDGPPLDENLTDAMAEMDTQYDETVGQEQTEAEYSETVSGMQSKDKTVEENKKTLESQIAQAHKDLVDILVSMEVDNAIITELNEILDC